MGSHLHIGYEHEISDDVHLWQCYFRVSDMKNFEAPGHATTYRQHSNIQHILQNVNSIHIQAYLVNNQKAKLKFSMAKGIHMGLYDSDY